MDEGKSKKGGGWFKAILGTLGGLFSGAAVMYLSAWVNQVVKPAKPVPNFRVAHEGRVVHFQDLSPGFTGWWDFGDGSELVPADAEHQTIDHNYDRPGDYNVKLSLSNLLGEESERAVTIQVEDPPEVKQPKVLSLKADCMSPTAVAPAAFKVTAKTANAPLCIWDVSDERPLEAVADDTASQERVIQLNEPGKYVIELAAVNGNRIDKATTTVTVAAPPAGAVGVVLAWTDAGTQLQKRTVSCMFTDTFRPDVKGERCPLSDRSIGPACSTDKGRGWIIRDVQVKGANGKQVSMGDLMDMPLDPEALELRNAQNLHLQMAKDRGSVRLAGDLVRSSEKNGGPPPSVVLQGEMTEELRTVMSRPMQVPAMMMAPAPGQTTTQYVALPAPPADWVDMQPPKLHLTVSDGVTVLAKDVPVPGQIGLTLHQRRCTLVATMRKDRVQLDLIAAGRPN
jgi:PKD repeat protein